MVLWGTDNLKSEGTQIAQALALIGARPRFDGYGRLSGAELVPLAELGRPRVDVIVTLSGIFRDLLPLQTRMLAEAAWLAAIGRRAARPELRPQAQPGPCRAPRLRPRDRGAARLLQCRGRLRRQRQHADRRRRVDRSRRDRRSVRAAEGLCLWPQRRPGAAGRTVQVRAWKASTSPTRTSIRSNSASPTSTIMSMRWAGSAARSPAPRARPRRSTSSTATQGATKVRTLGEQVDLETRTRMLNPLWYEGMLKHGFEGVRNIESHVTNTVGWSATTGEVSPWIYQKISETYVLDAEMRDRLATLNPKASARVANRLIEASDRNFWAPDEATLAALHAASDELEDRLEGVTAVAA